MLHMRAIRVNERIVFPRLLLFSVILSLACTGCSSPSSDDQLAEDTETATLDTEDTETTIDSETTEDTETETGEVSEKPKNIVIIIIDDYGVLSADSYKEDWYQAGNTPTLGSTPTVNKICSMGVRFKDAWSNPTCSPTRANILTGRHGFRTGIGQPCVSGSNEIRPDEPTLPRVIEAAGKGHALGSIGKWHLGTGDDIGGLSAPNFMGWQYYAGSVGGGLGDYFSWTRTENGVSENTTTYAPLQNIEDMNTWMATLIENQPYLLWVGFNAPHVPIHLPPSDMHSLTNLDGTDIETNPRRYFNAMVESVDTAISYVLNTLVEREGMDEYGFPNETLIIVLGDNGTQNAGQTKYLPEQFSSIPGKGSILEHGNRVPFCIAGTGVVNSGRTVDEMVHVADIYSTVLDEFEIAKPDDGFTRDSVSLSPYIHDVPHDNIRSFLFTEQFFSQETNLSTGVAIKNKIAKLVRYEEDGSVTPDECFSAKTGFDVPSTDSSLTQIEAEDVESHCSELDSALRVLVCHDDSYWQNQTWCQ